MTALGLQTPQHIIKRDGHLADFDPQKIWSAIYRCMISGHESAEVSGEAATTVTERVLRELAVLEESPSVEEVQDLVEKTLWHSGYQAGALAYIRYREMRRLLREEKSPKRARKKKAAEPGATFRLEESFVQKYRKIPPPWGFGVLSELTFLRTYARPKPDGTLERWFETIRRVVEGTYRMQERHIKAQNLGWNEKRAQKSAQEMYERMFWMKFLPPGRGLWAMGSVLTEERALFAALNNCFAHETEIITDQGVRAIGDLAGSEPVLLTTNGQWVSAPIRSFGKQQLYKISLIRQGIEKEIYATAEHRWFAKSQPMVNQSKGYAEFLTRELQPGYRLQYNFGKGISSVRPSPFGIAHGIAYGDATTAGNPCLYLCGEKNASLAHWFPNNPKTLDASKQAVRVADLPRFFRRLPDINESKSYLYGWLAGYFAADGSCKANGQCIISSYDRKNIEFARDVCVRLGIGTWSISSEERVSNLTGEKRISYSMGLMKDTLTEDFLLLPEHLENFRAANHDAAKRYWNVVSVEETDRYEQVYCATVEDKGAFTLADNILTGNCGFASTEEIDTDPFAPFLFLMDMSMLGVGVGFDTFGTGKIRIVSPGTADTLTGRWKKYYPLLSNREETVDWEGKPVVFDYEPRDGVFVIPDTREGWVVSALYILDAFFTGASLPRFDCSQVRPAGLVIKGFGGLTSGPGPLIEMHRRLIAFLTQYIGGLIDSEVITTLMNLKGKCVVSGNVRRTAEIAFGLPEDRGFLALKDYRYNAETGEYEGPRADRAEFGYTSNNSVFATLGMDYRECADRTRVNGEPGYAWLENMRAYGRMVDPPDHRDKRVKGGNPCLEQSLESWELCCLVETFIARHESLEDYRRTLKFAYLYAKTVTLGKTHWAETNKVMLRNRRIGCSMSGVQQFVAREGLDTLRKWCEAGYKTICDWDRVYSEWLCVPESIKKTSIKPSGTVSLLAGATPGMHWPENVCYLRRINVPVGSPLLPPLEQAGYPIEPNVNDPTSMIVAIPVKLDVPVRPVHQVSIWEQVAMAAFLQRYWADNQVSCTVTFDPETEGDQIERVLEHFQYSLKGISLLPKLEAGAYAQMPYEEISEARYQELEAGLKPVQLTQIDDSERELEQFCDGNACLLPAR